MATDPPLPGAIEVREAEAHPAPSGDKPLLASEALMEDLAPLEPAKKAARVWCAAWGVGYLAIGALPLVGLRPGGRAAAAPGLVLGFIALVAALTRVPYRRRAVAMVVLALLATAVGLRGGGPAAGIAVGGETWGLLRMVAATVLPAALMFRARYRAYAKARWILACAYGLALPFLVYSAALLVVGDFGLAQVGVVLSMIAVLASLAGFMGAETTGAASYTALAVALALTTELILQDLRLPGGIGIARLGQLAIVALAFAGTAALAALGLFQILAWRFAPDARRIDLRQAPREATIPPPSSPDWFSRR